MAIVKYSNKVECLGQYDGIKVYIKTAENKNTFGDVDTVVYGICFTDLENNIIYKDHNYNNYICLLDSDSSRFNLTDILDSLACYLNNADTVAHELIQGVLNNELKALIELKRFIVNYYAQLENKLIKENNNNSLVNNEAVKIEVNNNDVIVTRKIDNKQYNIYTLKDNETIEMLKESMLENIINDYSLLDPKERYTLIELMKDTTKEGKLKEVNELLTNIFNIPVMLQDKREYLGDNIYKHTYKGYINNNWVVISKGWYYNNYNERSINFNYGNTEYCYPFSKGLSCKVYHHIY